MRALIILALFTFACARHQERLELDSTLTVLHGSDEWLLNPLAEDEARLLLFLPLVRYEGFEPEPLPALAESWEHSDDYRRWTFFLRRDLKWHDGVPVTAHDVKFTIDLWSHPDVLSYPGPASGEITVVDDYTFSAEDDKPTNFLMSGWDVYYPKHLLEQLDPKEITRWSFWTMPVGNGPYRYVSHIPKTMMELEANPDYYAGKPGIEHVILKFSGGSPLTELVSGNVDAIRAAGTVDVQRVAGDSRFNVYHELRIGWHQILWNLRHDLFRDADVRRALTLAINRRELHQVLQLPEGTPLVDGACSRREFYGGRCEGPLPYDPEHAVQLLETAGWRDSDGDGVRDRDGTDFEFTLLVPPGDQETAATYVQEQLRRVGIAVHVQTVDASVVQERLSEADFEAAIKVIASAPVQHKAFLGEGGGLGYSNRRVNALLDTALITMDPPEFERLYRELGTILRTELPMTFLYPGVTFFIVNERVRGLENLTRADPLGNIEHLWIARMQ